MKSKCFRLWPVLAAGLMISPLCAQAPARPAASPPRDAPRDAPNPDRLKAAVGRIAELRKAGKQDEANQLSQRLREAAKDNPRVARQISEAMKAQQQPRTDAARPDRRRPEAPNRQDARKDAPTPQHRPMMRPQGPRRPMMRPRGPQGPQGPQAKPQPKPQACPLAAQAKPQACPLAAQAKSQRPMMGKATPEVRAQVGKIRHLAQASVHLAAAGYPDQAGKARAEAASLGTALKAKMTKAGAAKPKQVAPKAAAPNKHAVKKLDVKKPDVKKPDTNALVLGQLKSVSKQLNDLSSRVSKLEKAKHSDRD